MPWIFLSLFAASSASSTSSALCTPELCANVHSSKVNLLDTSSKHATGALRGELRLVATGLHYDDGIRAYNGFHLFEQGSPGAEVSTIPNSKQLKRLAVSPIHYPVSNLTACLSPLSRLLSEEISP